MIRDPSDGSVVQPPPPKRARPMTFYEFKAQYGENWGLDLEAGKSARIPKPAPTAEQLRHHYAHYNIGLKPKQDNDEC